MSLESENELMDWLDGLRTRTEEEVGLCTDKDYVFIVDRNGVAWQTETLLSGEQVKSKSEGMRC